MKKPRTQKRLKKARAGNDEIRDRARVSRGAESTNGERVDVAADHGGGTPDRLNRGSGDAGTEPRDAEPVRPGGAILDARLDYTPPPVARCFPSAALKRLCAPEAVPLKVGEVGPVERAPLHSLVMFYEAGASDRPNDARRFEVVDHYGASTCVRPVEKRMVHVERAGKEPVEFERRAASTTWACGTEILVVALSASA